MPPNTPPFSDATNRSIQKLGAEYISADDPAETEFAKSRWFSYLQAFFGTDFLWSLYEVDPNTPVLNPLNKIVSLNSSDTLTLAEALTYTGLAKDEVKQRILMKFQGYLQTSLPEKEFDWIKTNGIYKWYDVRWWGDANGGRKRVYKEALRKYKFAATTSFFERQACSHSSGMS